jgi:hypothetical protein
MANLAFDDAITPKGFFRHLDAWNEAATPVLLSGTSAVVDVLNDYRSGFQEMWRQHMSGDPESDFGPRLRRAFVASAEDRDRVTERLQEAMRADTAASGVEEPLTGLE